MKAPLSKTYQGTGTADLANFTVISLLVLRRGVHLLLGKVGLVLLVNVLLDNLLLDRSQVGCRLSRSRSSILLRLIARTLRAIV